MKPWEKDWATTTTAVMPWEKDWGEPQETTGEFAKGATRALLDVPTFGLADELSAGGRAIAETALKGGFNKNFADRKAMLNTEYKKALSDVQAEQDLFAERHPYWNTGLTLAGALVPTGGAISGATKGTMKLGANMLRGAGIAGLEGALYGFGSGREGERLSNAGWGALTGGIVGAATPLVLAGASSAGNAIKRIVQGTKEGLPEEQISDFILRRTIQPGKNPALEAKVLSDAAFAGDTSILNAATNLSTKIDSIGDLNLARRLGKNLIEEATDVPWSAATPSAKRIFDAIETPSLKGAKAAYRAFDAATPTNVKGAGLAFQKLAQEEPAVWRLINKELRENAPDWIDVPFTSRAGLKRMSEVLTSDLPKSNLTGIKARSVERGIKKLDDLTEALYPGSRAIDRQYKAASLIQENADKIAKNRIKQIAQLPFDPNLEVSLTGAGKLALRPWVRGKARELITTGRLYEGVPMYIHDPAREATNAILQVLREQGRAKGNE